MFQGRVIDTVVVFDLDDTLYLERDYVESGLRAVGAWATDQLGIAGMGEGMLEHFRAGARGHLFDDALGRAGIEPTSEHIARMIQVYRQHRPRIHLAEDAARYLACPLPRTGLALITDGYLDAQRRKIRALGLHAAGIEIAVCTDRWGREDWKPSCRAFDHVQAFFGLPADAFVYVADNPDKDFHAPRRLGWHSVRISRSGQLHTVASPRSEPADQEIDSLDALSI